LTDACGGSIADTISLSVFFQSPCSSVSLTIPEQDWASTLANNNQLPVVIGGYTLANLSTIAFEYRKQGAGWATGFSLTNAQLSPNSAQATWNTNALSDGQYELRLKLTCPQGVVYSQSVDGRIDRAAPVPVGNTQPTNDIYLTGSTIGIRYSEFIDCSRLTSDNVIAKRLSNGQTIPVTVGCNQDQLIITPSVSLSAYTGDVISLTLTGVSDLYGNLRSTPDIWSFDVGSTSAATGSKALSIAITNSPLSESAIGTMKLFSVALQLRFLRIGLSILG